MNSQRINFIVYKCICIFKIDNIILNDLNSSDLLTVELDQVSLLSIIKLYFP